MEKVQKDYSGAKTGLVIYNKELEKMFYGLAQYINAIVYRIVYYTLWFIPPPPHDTLSFTDFLQLFPLHRGTGSHSDPEDHVGCIKGAIKIYPIDIHEGELDIGCNLFRNIPSNSPVDIIVRVYVVKVSAL